MLGYTSGGLGVLAVFGRCEPLEFSAVCRFAMVVIGLHNWFVLIINTVK